MDTVGMISYFAYLRGDFIDYIKILRAKTIVRISFHHK